MKSCENCRNQNAHDTYYPCRICTGMIQKTGPNSEPSPPGHPLVDMFEPKKRKLKGMSRVCGVWADKKGNVMDVAAEVKG